MEKQAERTEAQEPAEQSNELEQAEKIHKEKLQVLGIMSASLAHEINNPLNYVMLSVELLKREGRKMLAPEYDGVVSDIEDGLSRIKNIVQDLKIYSRKVPAEDGKAEEFLVSEVVAASIRLVSAGAQEIEMVSTLDTPYRVKGDPSSIIQVLINLLTNAVDSIKRKGNGEAGKIDIIGKRTGERYVIEVVDNGEGMSRELIRKVFTPFFTTKGSQKGTGLGMGICRSIISRHGGKITVDSTLGSWTAVTFSLPLAD